VTTITPPTAHRGVQSTINTYYIRYTEEVQHLHNLPLSEGVSYSYALHHTPAHAQSTFEFHIVNWLPAPAILPATCIATSRQILFRHCEVPAKSSTGNRQSSASVSIVSSSSSSWSSRHGHVVVVLSLSLTHTRGASNLTAQHIVAG
jgi:hypothetical protein